MAIEPDMIKDHDLLVRLDEKVDSLARALEMLIKTLDARGQAIDDLKTANLLHNQETKTQWSRIDEINSRVVYLETKSKVDDAKVEMLQRTSILLWTEKHPKLAVGLATMFLIMLNFHDIIVPYLFSLIGYSTP